MTVRIGSLFSGYGGLDLAVEQATGGTTAWVSDVDKGACKVLAHRFPDAPNIGDITKVDWASVEPVDIITGGSPCQDLSHAGRRAGMTDGTRSNLWVQMRESIAVIRPSFVVWENVRGAYTAPADSDLEPCPGCVGDDPGVVLRALGRVLGDLADLGYDAAWHGLRAADVGAPHGRFRVFVLAWDTQNGGRNRAQPTFGCGERQGASRGPDCDPDGALTLLKTPTSQLAVNGGSQHPDKRKAGGHGPTLADEVEHLLPTPRATDGTKGGPNQRGSSGDLMLPSAVGQLLSTPRATRGGSATETRDMLLPTPRTQNNENRQNEGYGGKDGNFYGLVNGLTAWGQYAAAIARWEAVLGRPAPAPTMTSAKGNPQLSPRFVEWLMGLDDGYVCDVPDLTRNEQLKLLGNGVVPQQALAALHALDRIRLSGVAAPPSRPSEVLLPTPEGSDGSGGRVSKDKGGKRPSGAKRAITLATAVQHDLAPIGEQ